MSPRRFALAACVLLAGGVAAQEMSREEYKAHQARVQAEYLAAKERCKALQGNERGLCKVRAMGTRHVARAELAARYEPGPARAEKLALARAEAAYALEKERCDELRGHSKSVCRADAKAMMAAARAEAKAVRTAADSGPYTRESQKERYAARREQHDALYAAGRERCDALSGQAKDLCVADLRKRFGKL